MDFEKVFKSIKTIVLMRKEVGVYFTLAVLVGLVFFLAYSFDLQLTGFAVFDEAVSGFNGTFENVYYNGSAIVLNETQTSGTYTSEIFDANDSTQWNTLSSQGGIPDSKDNSVTNESGWINSAGYTLSGFDSSWSEITLTSLYDVTNNSLIGLENAAVSSLGVVTNATTEEWNNVLISYDYVSSFNASLSFQVKACDTSDCANVSFEDADLSDINLLGQYFQYKAFFSSSDSSLSPFLENVVINSSIGIVSVTISEPNGTKSSDTGIPITFAVTGLNLNCWYNVDNGGNVTLVDCSDSSFDVPDDGNYVFNLYVNNSLGAFDYQSSSFSVDTPAPTSSSSDDDEESSGGITTEATSEFVETVKLTAGEIQSLTMSPGEAGQLSWNVKNVWTFPLQECNFESTGPLYTWIPYLENKTLEAGEDHTFNFDVNVPWETELGEYNLGVTLKCPGTGKFAFFVVDVVEKAPEVESTDTQQSGEGAPVVGFVVFGEDGFIGTGEIVVLIIVVLVLVVILFVARIMRKSGKTLKDVFNDLEGVFDNFKFKFNDLRTRFKRP